MTAEDPLIVTIADAIVDADTLAGDLMPAARKVYAAIAATGRLLNAGVVVVATTDVAEGFTERTEWSAEPSLTPRFVTGPIESDREIVSPMRDPEQAMRDYLRGMRNRPALVRRTVYTGPWEAVDDHA